MAPVYSDVIMSSQSRLTPLWSNEKTSHVSYNSITQ